MTKNITVAVPEQTYIRARIWAAEHGVSVSHVVARLLENLPRHRRANQEFPSKVLASNPEHPVPISPDKPRSSQPPSFASDPDSRLL